jgi:hypothetical protein
LLGPDTFHSNLDKTFGDLQASRRAVRLWMERDPVRKPVANFRDRALKFAAEESRRNAETDVPTYHPWLFDLNWRRRRKFKHGEAAAIISRAAQGLQRNKPLKSQ